MANFAPFIRKVYEEDFIPVPIIHNVMCRMMVSYVVYDATSCTL